MAVIVVSPVVVDPDVGPSDEVVQLQVTVESEDFEGLFDTVEVWRSTAGSSGPFEEITDERWRAARIPKTADDEPTTPATGESVALVGKELELRVNEDEDNDILITFTGVDPLTFADAATQVTAQGLGKVRAYVAADGTFVVETTQSGSGAVLRVLESDGAAILGLPTTEPDSLASGKEARIELKLDQVVYTFKDLRGSDAYYYRTRFSNSVSGSFSEFSPAFSVGAAPGLLPDHLACGRLELVGLNGSPLSSARVTVYNAFQSSLIDGRLVAESRQSKVTDEDGVVEFTLVRGSRVTVAISNTSIVRDIAVPEDAETVVFNLLDPSVSAGDDVFKVQVPDIVYAERRSL